MKNIIHKYSGKSLLELRKKFGIGESGFYDNNWWLKESFAKEKAPKGIYEINFEGKFGSKSWQEQEDLIPQGWERGHEAIIAEAVLTHYKKTGKRLLENCYHWGKSLDSFGLRVGVGYFDRDGLNVYFYWADDSYDYLRVCLLRKFQKGNLKAGNFDYFESLESRVASLESDMAKLRKIINL